MFDSLELPPGQNESIAVLTADDVAVYVVVEVIDYSTQASAQQMTTRVFRVPVCGGTPMLLGSRVSDQLSGQVSSALVGQDRVFWVAGDGIYSLPTTGGSVVTETTSTNISSLAVHGDQLYWVDDTAALWAVPSGGAGQPHIVAQTTVPTAWTSLAVDGDNAYVTQMSLSDGASAVPTNSDMNNGSIVAIALADGSMTTLAAPVFDPGNIVVAGKALYWTSDLFMPSDTTGGMGAIEGMSLPMGGMRVLAVNEDPPPGPLMVLGDSVYWLTSSGIDGSTTVRVLHSGGAPVTIPIDLPALGVPVVLAPSGVYWYGGIDDTFGRNVL
jgi:hypothetical protein